MSTLKAATRWLERISDWSNPILVKETRQALKSRQFVITFMLLLLISWLISVFALMQYGSAIEYGSPGRAFFSFYYVVLSVAIFVVVPFIAYRSLLNEREHNTFDLLSITTLTPRQIVWGKLFSAIVQILIYYSAIAPFIAFTSLLQGFDLAQVTLVLMVSVLASIAVSMVALMFSTVARQRHFQAVMTLIVLVGVLILEGIVLGVFFDFAIYSGAVEWDDPDFWWGLGFAFLAGMTYMLLAQQITTAQLTFESDNRSTGIRITCSAQFWLLWASLIVYHLFYSSLTAIDDGFVFAFASISGIHWTIVGVFAATEHDFLSRRIRRNLPRSGLLRLLIVPFLPGGSRGLIYLTGHLAALWLISFAVAIYAAVPNIDEIVQYVSALCSYIIIYVGFGTALGRWGRSVSSELQPAHSRVLILLLLAAGMIAPYLPGAFGLVDFRSRYSILEITNPFSTLSEIDRTDGGLVFVSMILLGTAVLALFINLRACVRGGIEIMKSDVRPRTRVETVMINDPEESGDAD